MSAALGSDKGQDAREVAHDGAKKEEDGEPAAPMPFVGLDKGSVLQEKRVFSETPLNPRKCCTLLTKVLYLIHQGVRLTTTEATDLFFAITRLFQSKDVCSQRLPGA